MNKVLFEDNMKEFGKRFIPLFIALLMAVVSAIVLGIRDGAESIDTKVIVLLCLVGAVVLGALYCFIYVMVYSVSIQDNILTTKSIVGKKDFRLTNGMTYSYKKIVSGYYLIIIKTEDSKISVRTKKPKELVDILLTYDVKLEEIKN